MPYGFDYVAEKLISVDFITTKGVFIPQKDILTLNMKNSYLEDRLRMSDFKPSGNVLHHSWPVWDHHGIKTMI